MNYNKANFDYFLATSWMLKNSQQIQKTSAVFWVSNKAQDKSNVH